MRAHQAFESNPDTRQVVLQIWDSHLDLPSSDGTPADRDVPCNVVAMPKLRDGRLEWLQVIRSNDMFLGVPHNFVQFTSLQEVLAGWLGVECGSYTQISDSLHVYEHHWENVKASTIVPNVAPNDDHLTLPRRESDQAFKELERRIERLIDPETQSDTLEGLASWDSAPQALQEHSGRAHSRGPPPSRPHEVSDPSHVSLHQPGISSALVPVVLDQAREGEAALRQWHS